MEQDDDRANTTITPLLVDARGMAALLSVSPDVLTRMRTAGCPIIVVPGTKGMVRYEPRRVMQWIETQQTDIQPDSTPLGAAEKRLERRLGLS